MLHKETGKSILGAAMIVLNELKPGLKKKLYENALLLDYRTQYRSIAQFQRIQTGLETDD